MFHLAALNLDGVLVEDYIISLMLLSSLVLDLRNLSIRDIDALLVSCRLTKGFIELPLETNWSQ
jgi:hypothetical protein